MAFLLLTHRNNLNMLLLSNSVHLCPDWHAPKKKKCEIALRLFLLPGLNGDEGNTVLSQEQQRAVVVLAN
jgi:hypothetical protein